MNSNTAFSHKLPKTEGLNTGIKDRYNHITGKRIVDVIFAIIIIIIIMVIFTCYFSGEHIATSSKKNNNGVDVELGKTNRLKALCMMQVNIRNKKTMCR